MLPGRAFLLFRALRVEPAAIRGRLQNAYLAALKLELEGVTRWSLNLVHLFSDVSVTRLRLVLVNRLSRKKNGL